MPIEFKDLDFAYNGETVLQDVNLSVRARDYIAIIGPNGGGKTTLLKLILDLLTPDRGAVRVDGQSPLKASACIGYVPQDVHMNRRFTITAIDVVLMGKRHPQKRWSRPSAADRREALAALERLEMAAQAHKKIGLLSGGHGNACSLSGPWCPSPKFFCRTSPPPVSTPRARPTSTAAA